MSDREEIYLSEQETVELINATGPRGTMLELTLGSGLLPDIPANEWAREFILDQRYHAPAAGALAMEIQETYRWASR